jgi:fructose-1,6-bisphosphatase-3
VPNWTGPQLDYLSLFAQQFPSIQAASTEIISLTAQLRLPKGTEHFVSDVHGEYEALRHLLKNGSGSIRRLIDELFQDSLPASDRQHLATLIYYPRQKLPLMLRSVDDQEEWYRVTLLRLIKVARNISFKYPRATLEGFLREPFADLLEELLSEQEHIASRVEYYQSIVETIIGTASGDTFVVALAELIQQLAIARLHVIGDIFDRGPGAHLILDMLLDHHCVDIQWGNHDILWMGAAAGSEACIANVVRICLRYGGVDTLETGYGISLLPLASFALDAYADDPCTQFLPSQANDQELTNQERLLMARMHKAICIIQFKLEAQVVRRRPHYHMEDRLLLENIDQERGTVEINGVVYPLLDCHFPTLDPQQPYELTPGEKSVVDKLNLSFLHSRRLQKHVRFLFSRGSMYLVHNGNLLFHGCLPMKEDGSFLPFQAEGREFAGKEYMDRVDRLVRQGYFDTTDAEQKQYGMDATWYLWSGPQSPLFGKAKMATFERYLVDDPVAREERRNAYYDLRDNQAAVGKMLTEFGLDPEKGHIINGHVPVRVGRGESPVRAGGKLIVIDGGFAKAYHERTGIAGYTLVHNSWGLLLAAHQPFESSQQAIEHEVDIDSRTEILETNNVRIRVGDTDAGREIRRRIEDLNALLHAYRTGLIKEG